MNEFTKIRHEKLEETLEEITKIETLVLYIKAYYLSMIQGLEKRELPFKTETPLEQLKVLLSLYGKEFQEDIEEFDNAWDNLRHESIEIIKLMHQKSQRGIANMASDVGLELLNVCKKMKDKIKNIIEKEYKK